MCCNDAGKGPRGGPRGACVHAPRRVRERGPGHGLCTTGRVSSDERVSGSSVVPGAVAPPGLAALLGELFPGEEMRAVEPLSPDAAPRAGATGKAAGYGAPLRIVLAGPGGAERVLVFRTATANEFGHDRRSDRAQVMLLAYDTFSSMPRHVRALDVGAVGADGRLVSLRGSGEIYLLTTWAPGRIYAEDLRAVAAAGAATALDLARCTALARWLAELHRARGGTPGAYVRAVRDLVGSGEGLFGIVDSYPADTPAAPPARLQEIERQCLAWRWRLRGCAGRLRRTHGDFHPFNVLFSAGEDFTLLDASRGGWGDPADDVTAMVVNYVFFAAEQRAAWRGLGPLWRRFWAEYLSASGDGGLLDVCAPWLAWRVAVVADPRFYPGLSAAARDLLLRLAESALAAPRFDPAMAEALFE